MNSRMYDSKIARFLQEDTYAGDASDPLSLNLYAYCHNDPIMYDDPTGHWDWNSFFYSTGLSNNPSAVSQILNDASKANQKVDGIIQLTGGSTSNFKLPDGMNVNVGSGASISTMTTTAGSSNIIGVSGSSGKVKAGSIGTLITGDKSTTNIINNGTINTIKTGLASTTDINNNNYIGTINVDKKSTCDINSSGKSTIKNINRAIGSTTTINGTGAVFDTNGAGKVVDLRKAVGNVCYIFYLPQWKNEANDDRKRLAAYYGLDKDQIILVPVSSADDLTKGWNNMGNVKGKKLNTSAVVIDTHANASGLGFGNGNGMELDTISKLDKKNVGALILYGCNAGHLDFKDDNPASAFAKNVKGSPVIASDGTVNNGTPRIFGLFGAYTYKSVNDEPFQDQLIDGPRNNKGWIIYEYKDGSITTKSCNDKNLTLSQMLKKINKLK